MVRFIDNIYACDSIKSKVSNIKWKTACGIGMVGIYFITMSDNDHDLFDIYSASMFKQRGLRKSNLIIIGIADGYEEATLLTAQMINDSIEETGDVANVKNYFKSYIQNNL